MSNLSGFIDRLKINTNYGSSRGSTRSASSSRLSSSPFSAFSSFSGIETGSFLGIDPDPEIDAPTQLLLAQLTLADLVAYRATLKNKRPVTRSPDDVELALQQQEDELRALIAYIKDSALARSIDKAVETDAELIRALEVMERSKREDRRAAEIFDREDRLPRPTEAQSMVGRKEFVVPERFVFRFGTTMTMTMVKRSSRIRSAVPPSLAGGLPTSHLTLNRSKSSHSAYIPGSDAVPKLECVSCTDKVPKTKCLTATCKHIYCHACIISLVEACIRDETLYPVKCCQQPLSRTQLESILTVKLRMEFDDKCREFGTPAQLRVYCNNPRCSAFLGSSSGTIEDIFCGSCRTSTCTECKRASHPRERCPENEDAIRVRKMAADQGWQTCPGCRAIIELDTGCYHMTCRCRTEFCYLCAARWKTCPCPHWDENRLVVDARRRVENEMGPGARIQENQVRARVADLRTRHECVVHDWRNRQGGGDCEHCGHYLPIFLKICRGCQMLVCRRCALNRL
ncbi:hypothetical protein JOM56_011098 [Amanita muscaria]